MIKLLKDFIRFILLLLLIIELIITWMFLPFILIYNYYTGYNYWWLFLITPIIIFFGTKFFSFAVNHEFFDEEEIE
jgi:hypothetical protein